MLDPSSAGILDQTLHEFLQALQHDFSKIESMAKGLFYYLAGIQIAVSSLWMMFKGDPLSAVVKTIQLFFTLAFFYTLVLFCGSWMPQIINGFIAAGSSAAGIGSLTPSSVMDQGLSIGFALFDSFGHWGWVAHPLGCLITAVILIAIVILYALLAAEISVILVKCYVLVALSGLMFAFGANEAVRPIAMNYFKSVIGIGLQLMTFYLIMGVGVQIGHDWSTLIGQATQNHEIKPFLVVMAAVIVFYLVIKNVPPFVAGLSGVGGFRNYGDEAVGTVLTAAGVGGSAAMNALKGGGKAPGAAMSIGKAAAQGAVAVGKAAASVGKGAAQMVGSIATGGAGAVVGAAQGAVAAGKAASAGAKGVSSAVRSLKGSAPDSSFKANEVAPKNKEKT